ncbi:MAG: hypothetical protein HY855_00695 [Burkholderiales bacterium]|nr:hypothetical protein [Burkholderiales bacterium]
MLLAALLAALAAPLQAADTLATARAATDRGAYAQALDVYQQLLAARPDDADLLIEVARVNGFADRNAEAARLYRRVLGVAPQRRADVLAALAWQTLWAGDAAAALALFDEQLAPEATRPLAGAARAEALDGRAQARQALGEQAGALAAYREAVASLPAAAGGHRALRRRLALSLLWNDRHAEAIAALQALLAEQPDDRDSAWALANAQNFGGLHRQALRTFGQLGAPRSAGERFDLARAWRWAGYEDQAAPLLAGQTDREAVWLRDWRIARELAPYAYATVEHSIDRDRLESLAWVAGAGWHPRPGASLEAQARQVEFDDANGAVRAQQFQLLYRWRLGQATDDGGSWWPTVALRASSLPGWTPLAPTLRLTWLPRDHWRVDAELTRELVETPMAVAHRVTVDALALGLDHRPDARWSFAAAAAALRFDDGNVRLRLSGRAEWTLAMKPRWVVGVDGMQFGSSRPASDTRPSRGYWNPRRYGEVRVTSTLTHEARPFDVYARLAFGTALEVDGEGRRSHGTPNQWELGLGLDLAPSLRLRLAGGGAGNGFGLSNGGAGYWRRYLNLSLNGWF